MTPDHPNKVMLHVTKDEEIKVSPSCQVLLWLPIEHVPFLLHSVAPRNRSPICLAIYNACFHVTNDHSIYPLRHKWSGGSAT